MNPYENNSRYGKAIQKIADLDLQLRYEKYINNIYDNYIYIYMNISVHIYI